MQFPTVDPESEWTPEQLEEGCRVVGAKIDADDRSRVWLEIQFHIDASYIIIEPGLGLFDSDAVSE